MKQKTKLSVRVLAIFGILMGTIASFFVTIIESVVGHKASFIGWLIAFIFFLIMFVREVVKLLEYVERLPKDDSV